jgi:hypothetical protein
MCSHSFLQSCSSFFSCSCLWSFVAAPVSLQSFLPLAHSLFLRSYTFRNRGTEFTKSPEMLQVAYASQKTRATYDRRKHVCDFRNPSYSLV